MFIIATLIFLGILLMLIEMLLIPGVGIAGVLSLLSLVSSCWYAFKYMSPRAGILVTIIVICLLAAMLMYILRAKTWKKFEAHTVIDAKVNDEGNSLSTGQQGVAETRLAPMGTARFDETTCEVKSFDNSMVDAGTKIEIVRIEDNKVIVKPIINQ